MINFVELMMLDFWGRSCGDVQRLHGLVHFSNLISSTLGITGRHFNTKNVKTMFRNVVFGGCGACRVGWNRLWRGCLDWELFAFLSSARPSLWRYTAQALQLY